MILKKFEFSDVFAANCYFYIDEKSKHGFIVDPSAHADILLQFIDEQQWHIEKIFLTHSHLDHIGAVLPLAQALQIKYYGLNMAQKYLSNPNFATHFTNHAVLENMTYCQDGDEISLSSNKDIVLKVLATPGHTLDSAVYYDKANNIAFTGDTIFQSGIGRTDIEGSGGNPQQLMHSIKTKILTLPDCTILYPGHGEATTVKQEKHML